ncbi:hypothetical protein KSP39_PZI007033 [Platanthera zijinensis]|uniref:Uncharacterized protein n=1 Tax=Platanthera zijinensis TaxID=2320716 RepID=A0AAP0BPX8_9ASPA
MEGDVIDHNRLRFRSKRTVLTHTASSPASNFCDSSSFSDCRSSDLELMACSLKCSSLCELLLLLLLYGFGSSLLEKLRLCFLGQSASVGGGANHEMPTVEENIELIMLNPAYIGASDYDWSPTRLPPWRWESHQPRDSTRSPPDRHYQARGPYPPTHPRLHHKVDRLLRALYQGGLEIESWPQQLIGPVVQPGIGWVVRSADLIRPIGWTPGKTPGLV